MSPVWMRARGTAALAIAAVLAIAMSRPALFGAEMASSSHVLLPADPTALSERDPQEPSNVLLRTPERAPAEAPAAASIAWALLRRGEELPVEAIVHAPFHVHVEQAKR